MLTPRTAVLSIDRTTPFNPAAFIGNAWTIWRGPADGTGLDGDEEQDERSLALTTIDLTTVRIETMLTEGERLITGEERLTRLKEKNHIRLDAKVFQTLWQNQHLHPRELEGDGEREHPLHLL
jgi:hypothetical protein